MKFKKGKIKRKKLMEKNKIIIENLLEFIIENKPMKDYHLNSRILEDIPDKIK